MKKIDFESRKNTIKVCIGVDGGLVTSGLGYGTKEERAYDTEYEWKSTHKEPFIECQGLFSN